MQGTAVYQQKNKANLFFTETSKAENCFPMSCFDNEGKLVKLCTFFVDTEAKIVGGTGKFAGATGFLNLSGSATILFVDDTGIFGGASSEGTGKIIIP